MKTKILIIEDDQILKLKIEKTLSSKGYTLFTVKDYKEAVEILSGETIDLVLSDIMLEDEKTGIDILRKIKEMKLKCITVIFTAYARVETATEAVRLGAFDYLEKPIHPATLLNIINKALIHKSLCDENEKYKLNLEAIFRSIPDGIISIDNELTVVELNEGAKNICGFSRDSSIGKLITDLPKNCSEECAKIFKKTIDEKQMVELENINCHHNDRPTQTVSVISYPLIV
jgi:PAS domain S-box-containing protein